MLAQVLAAPKCICDDGSLEAQSHNRVSLTRYHAISMGWCQFDPSPRRPYTLEHGRCALCFEQCDHHAAAARNSGLHSALILYSYLCGYWTDFWGGGGHPRPTSAQRRCWRAHAETRHRHPSLTPAPGSWTAPRDGDHGPRLETAPRSEHLPLHNVFL